MLFDWSNRKSVADLGGPEGLDPPTSVKTSQKRWPPHGAASIASHRPPSDKFLDLLLGNQVNAIVKSHTIDAH